MSKLNSDISFITKNQWVFHLVGIAVVFVVLGLAIQMHKESKIDQIIVDISAVDSNKYLIAKEEVVRMINTETGYDTQRGSLKRVNAMQLEYLLDKDARVKDADVYIDKHSNIHVAITQREPIVRIMKEHQAYYLDTDGKYVPLSNTATIRVPIVTGAVDDYNPDYVLDPKNNLNSIYKLAAALSEDAFLHALIEQIDIDANDEITMIPKMGRNKIKLGTTENIDDKLYRLKVFYKKAISKYGTDKFSELDLQYEDRVFSKENKS